MGRFFLVAGFVLAILIGAVTGAWWYLFGPAGIDPAQLVPAQTLALASIPNGTAHRHRLSNLAPEGVGRFAQRPTIAG